MPPKAFRITSLAAAPSPQAVAAGGSATVGSSTSGSANNVAAGQNLTRVSSGHEYPVSPMALGNCFGQEQQQPSSAEGTPPRRVSPSASSVSSATSHSSPVLPPEGPSPSKSAAAAIAGGGTTTTGSSSSGSGIGRSGSNLCATLDFVNFNSSNKTTNTNNNNNGGGSLPASPACYATMTPQHPGSNDGRQQNEQQQQHDNNHHQHQRGSSTSSSFCSRQGHTTPVSSSRQPHSHHHQSSSSSAEWVPGRNCVLARNVVRVSLDTPKAYHVVKTVSCPHRAQREFDHWLAAPMHPAILRYLKFKLLDSGGALVTMEYANRGTLEGIISDLNDLLAVEAPPSVSSEARRQQQKRILSDDESSESQHAEGQLCEEEQRQHQYTREQLAKAVARQILDALLYYERVHRRWHRDVKPDNILCRNDGVLKLSDFDVSHAAAGTTTGTLNYMAPDYLRAAQPALVRAARRSPNSAAANINTKDEEYNVDPGKADVWSIGCVLYQIIFGMVPFVRANMMDEVSPETVERLVRDDLTRVRDPQLRALLRRCLVWDSEQRACLAEATAMTYFFFCDKQQQHQHQQCPAAAATPSKSTTSSSSSSSSTKTSEACQQCVRLCDCVMDVCGERAASPSCLDAFDSYGADLSTHPLGKFQQKQKQRNDSSSSTSGSLNSKHSNAAASAAASGPSISPTTSAVSSAASRPTNPAEQQPRDFPDSPLHPPLIDDAAPKPKTAAQLADTVQCMLEALTSELDTFKQCIEAKHLDDLPLGGGGASSNNRQRSVSSSSSTTSPNKTLPPRGDELLRSTAALSHAASTTSLDTSADAIAYSPESPEQQQQQQHHQQEDAESSPTSASVFSPVAPGTALERLNADEEQRFRQRFAVFVNKYRLPTRTAERAFDKKNWQMTEEEVVAKVVRISVSEEMRKHWSERNKPVYSVMKEVLRKVESETMRSPRASSIAE